MAKVEDIQPKAVTHVEKGPMIPGAPNSEVEGVVLGIAEKMAALMEILHTSPVITDEDKKEFSKLLAGYNHFVKENLGAAPGEPIKKSVAKEQVSMEGGANENAIPLF